MHAFLLLAHCVSDGYAQKTGLHFELSGDGEGRVQRWVEKNRLEHKVCGMARRSTLRINR